MHSEFIFLKFLRLLKFTSVLGLLEAICYSYFRVSKTIPTDIGGVCVARDWGYCERCEITLYIKKKHRLAKPDDAVAVMI